MPNIEFAVGKAYFNDRMIMKRSVKQKGVCINEKRSQSWY